MAKYYGVVRSEEYLAHYGVRGMKWGVRKAKERGNSERLARHYKKANKKLDKLKRKADILNNYELRKYAPSLIGAGIFPTAGGIALPIVARSSGHKMALDDYGIAGFNTAVGAGMIGSGVYSAIAGGRRTKAKGHNRAVKKVNDWQKEMKTAFKGTKYEKRENSRPDYKDVYTLYEHGTLGRDKKGQDVLYRAPTISVKGSDILRDSNTKAKKIFKKRLTEEPVTQNMSDSRVWLGVQSPSGRTYDAETVNKYLKIKKRRK